MRLWDADVGETKIFRTYRICETFADFSLERVKASVTKHDECDFLILLSVCSTGGVMLTMVSSKLGQWTRAIVVQSRYLYLYR